MFTIKTLNPISEVGTGRLPADRYTVAADVPAPDAVLVRSADMHTYDLEDSLLAIGRAGAGVNNIPVDTCSQHGIVVFNTPGANAGGVKEMVLCGLLLSSRKVPAALQWVQTLKGRGDEVGKLVEKGKKQFVGPELAGKRLGVIGLGAIGIRVANTARHLGMEVMGYDPYMSVDAAWKMSRAIIHAKDLAEIYTTCDYITLHVPYTKDTAAMIDAQVIASMKPGGRILNFARGELVDSQAVLSALDSGHLGCYVTDFPQDCLLGHPGVVAIPHLGASTPESEDNCAVMAVEELRDYLENGNIKNSVNLPAATMVRSGTARLCVIHQNIPAMISSIAAAVSDAGLNVENLLNKSRGEYAYTMIDVNAAVPQPVLQQIAAIDGVVRVRAI